VREPRGDLIYSLDMFGFHNRQAKAIECPEFHDKEVIMAE
jgi:hypothetical protein